MTILSVLLEITLYSAVLYGALMVFRRLAGSRVSAQLRHGLWFLLAARLLMPITMTVPVALITLPERPAVVQAIAEPLSRPASSGVLTTPQPARPQPTAAPARSVSAAAHLAAATQRGLSVRLHWPALLLGLWAAGAALMAANLLRLTLGRSRRLRQAGAPPPPALQRQALALAQSMGLRRCPRLLLCADIATPCLAAGLRPVLLLPTGMALGGTPERISFALGHELTHCRRRDDLIELLWSLLRCIHWYNPVVWLAARAVREDMELACDSTLVRPMDAGQRKQYAQTLLEMFTHGREQTLTLGMAHSNVRRAAEQRIRGIFAPATSGKGARALAATLALALLVGCFTTACQPTPQKQAVVGKNFDKLESAIKATAAPSAQTTATAKAIKEEFPAADEKVTIRVDAKAALPAGPIPVIRVEPYDIPMDLIKKAANVLFEGNAAYEPEAGMTKAELQEEILKAQKFIGDWDKLVAYYGGGKEGEETAKGVKEDFTWRIGEYQKQLDTAPDTRARRQTDWTFRPDAYYEDMIIYGEIKGDDRQSVDVRDGFHKSQTIRVDTEIGEYHARLEAYNLSTDSQETHRMFFTLGGELAGNGAPKWNEKDARALTISPEQAVAMVQEKLEAIGLQGYTVRELLTIDKQHLLPETEDTIENQGDEAENQQPYAYSISFAKTYAGIASDGDLQPWTSYDYERDFGPRYQSEDLAVLIENDRIISLRWVGPLDQLQTENDNVGTLSLDKAMETFRSQMKLIYNLENTVPHDPGTTVPKKYLNSIESAQINITDVRLRLWRMAIQDHPGQYRMVPIWMFYGTQALKVTGEATPADKNPPLRLFLCVNALDGTVFDTKKGY